MGAVSVTKRNEPEGRGFISQWMWTSGLGGTEEPLLAHKSSPCSAGHVLSVPRALRLDAQVSFLRLDGFPGVEWGHVPFSDWDLEGGRDRQLLKVPGPMPSPQVSLPSD